MMNLVIVAGKILISLFIMLFIVTIHELGHYFAARLLNVKVKEFAVGIGSFRFMPRYIDSNGTIWRLGLFPIGGYVMMAGENESTIPEEEGALLGIKFIDTIQNYFYSFLEVILDNEEIPNEKIKGRYFSECTQLNKVFFALAGPISNFLLSIAILSFAYTGIGRRQFNYEIKENVESLRKGDLLVRVNNVVPISEGHVSYLIEKDSNVIEIIRPISDESLKMSDSLKMPTNSEVPNQLELSDAFKNSTSEVASLLVKSSLPFQIKNTNTYSSVKLSLIDSVLYAIYDTYTHIFIILSKIKDVLLKLKFNGVASIIKIGYDKLSSDMYTILFWTCTLSISLGVFNLLIIPPLDGGVALLAIVEMIFGKNERFESFFQNVATLVVIFLLVVTIKDIRKVASEKTDEIQDGRTQ
jgi:regulator of sigma E protease